MRRPFRFWLRAQFSQHTLRVMAVILGGVYVVCTLSVTINERLSWGNAMSRTAPTFLGELGDIEGTLGTRVSIMVGLITSVAFLTVVTSLIVSHFVRLALQGGTMVDASSYRDHIIICGWNFQAENIISQLFSEDIRKKRAVLVLAPLEKNPSKDDRVDFISGDPTRRDDLIRAGIMYADTAVVLTEFQQGTGREADALALMITLAIETLNPEVHTCVQVRHGENRQHLDNANVDEVICLDNMGGNLTVATALNHGVASVVQELLCFDKGSEIYRCKEPLTKKYVGMSYTEAAKQLIDEKRLLVAVETKDDATVRECCPNERIHSRAATRAIVVNPQGEYCLREGDVLFLIAESEPTGL